jgi:peroxiredoxin
MEGRTFELISVDYAEERDRILEFLADVDVDFPVLLDKEGKVSADWNVLVFPSTFVIGPDGRIVYGVKGGIHWDSPDVTIMLKELLQAQH